MCIFNYITDLINIFDNCISRFAYIRLTERPACPHVPRTHSLSQVENQNHCRRADKYIGHFYFILFLFPIILPHCLIIIPIPNYFALTDYKQILLYVLRSWKENVDDFKPSPNKWTHHICQIKGFQIAIILIKAQRKSRSK